MVVKFQDLRKVFKETTESFKVIQRTCPGGETEKRSSFNIKGRGTACSAGDPWKAVTWDSHPLIC